MSHVTIHVLDTFTRLAFSSYRWYHKTNFAYEVKGLLL